MRTDSAYLGTLGDRAGVNVAKVEVIWFFDDAGLGPDSESSSSHTGHYIVHATGNEPEAQGEDGTIYTVFEDLVHAAMNDRQRRLGFHDYDIEDISSH